MEVHWEARVPHEASTREVELRWGREQGSEACSDAPPPAAAADLAEAIPTVMPMFW